MRLSLVLALTLAALSVAAPLAAAEVHVAVAANFAPPMQVLGTEFERSTGHKVVVVSGATGKLYAQVKNGAPFDVFLSADDSTPAKLEAEGLALKGSRFTYAIGKLVLYSARPNYVDDQGKILRSAPFAHLALANPKLAPYGAAAVAVLSALGLYDTLRPKFVQGENIAQTFEFVATENAELGFVALSQILAGGAYRPGSWWVVPETLYPELRQDAVQLAHGAKNVAAPALLAFLRSEGARKVIASHGYGLIPVPAPSPAPAPASAK